MKSEMQQKNSPVIRSLVAISIMLPFPLAAQQIDRTVLPVPEPKPPTITELDARNAKAPPRLEVKAPKEAPNVVVVLLDDIGFGQPSAFGGPCKMPTLDKLAATGLRYNDFHTTALCSPTRTALLTGRNHHVNNAGAIMELATAFPGNTGIRPNSVAPLAEYSARTVIAQQPLGNTTKRHLGRFPCPGPSIGGRPIPVSISSMALLVVRPTNGLPQSSMGL